MFNPLEHLIANAVASQPHYTTNPIQPIEIICANDYDFLEGNIFKYLTRFSQKNGVEDLLKAKQYLTWLHARGNRACSHEPKHAISVSVYVRVNRIAGTVADILHAVHAVKYHGNSHTELAIALCNMDLVRKNAQR